MAQFRYSALDGTGQRVRGVVEAASEPLALADLEAKSLTPLTLSASGARPGLRVGRPSPAVLARAYGGASDLIAAGVPVLRALRLLGRGKSHAALAAAFREVADRVADGEDLSEAMSRRSEFFRRPHVAMIRAGEKAGSLDEALARLAGLLERQAELRSKVVGSLIYPGVLLTLGAAVLAVVFIVFVPQFRPLFARLPDLPTPTVIVFGISDALTRRGLISLVVVACALVAGFVLMRRDDVRRRVEMWPLRAPLLGGLLRSIAVARICRLLGSMLAAGVPMLSALQVTRDAAGHRAFAKAIEGASEAVRAGEPLAKPLTESRLLSEEVAEMITVGEAANTLDTVLLHVADALERRVDRTLNTLVKLIEPLLLVVLASVVGLVAVALLLPLTQLSDQV
ncbi:MAG: type II secretion system F family protein [Planctomycetota bacterium]